MKLEAGTSKSRILNLGPLLGPDLRVLIILVLPEYPAKLRQWDPGVVPVSPLGFPDKGYHKAMVRRSGAGRGEPRAACAPSFAGRRMPVAPRLVGRTVREAPRPGPLREAQPGNCHS
jgi:hypothetical protein